MTLPTTPTAAELKSLALLKVRGDDAQDFLQGQLSNDVAALGDDAQLNAYCNPKGRVLAVIRLLRVEDGFGLVVPREIADGLMKRLKMFVLRAKVEIELETERMLVGTINFDAGAANVTLGIENVPYIFAPAAVAGIAPRYFLITDKLPTNCKVIADDSFWQLADILSGIPQVYPATAEEFIPQMLNMDLVDGLSFSKGCYPGQEIVARLRYLGKVKQRMLAGQVAEKVAAGDTVYTVHSDGSEKKVGLVVDAIKQNGKYIFSATAPSGDDSALAVGSPTGNPITRIELPYPAPTEEPQ